MSENRPYNKGWEGIIDSTHKDIRLIPKHVAAYLNTRNGWSLDFGGVALTLPDTVTN